MNTAIIKNTFNKVAFRVQKHVPEILVGAGVVGTVASAVLACRATLKVDDILDETSEKVDIIHESVDSGKTPDGRDYSVEDSKKDLVIVYSQTVVKFVKLYGPSVALGAASIASILSGHNILRKRNLALAAAYTIVDQSFKDYRSRVIDRFGETVDKELKHNLKATKFKIKEEDEETGKTKTVTKPGFVVNNPTDVSEYARFFDRFSMNEDGESVINPYWNDVPEYNLMFLKSTERYANERLVSQGRLFLNEVYDMLGIPRSKAGQIVGWVYDPEKGNGDNYVDFGLYKDNLSYSDFVNGFDPAILLDFNVDGNVWDLM